MAIRKASDAEFLDAWQRLQSPTLVAGELGYTLRRVYDKRRELEAKDGIALDSMPIGKCRNIEPRIVPEYVPAPAPVIKRKPLPEGRTHCVIPDAQVRAGVPLDHLEWAGKYIADKKPDVIICIGDFADMQSLSRYNSKRKAENLRYKKDIEAVHYGMELLMTPIVNEPNYKPRLVMVPGNHEEMINRYVDENPIMEGTISARDLGYEAWGWEVQPYLKPIKIDGIAYAHYFYHPKTSKPYGGENLHTRLKTIGFSFTMGHQQGLSIAIRDLNDETRQRGLVCGSFYQHEEEYKGPQGNGHWHGIIFKHEVRDGNYDLLEVSLEYLRRKYG